MSLQFLVCHLYAVVFSSLTKRDLLSRAYLSTPDGHSLAILNLPFNSNDLSDKVLDHWRKGIVYKRHWDKNEFQNWTQAMIDQGQVETKESYIGNSPAPESLDLHFAPFKQGMLYVGNKAPLSQHEIDLVKSLAEAFSIAYSRYEDFRSLEQAKLGIEAALNELKSTQTQLIQSEKMASLGEVTAGIAHEIQNPLNFVTNFSDLNDELISEMTDAMDKGNLEEARLLAKNIQDNEEKNKSSWQAGRCDCKKHVVSLPNQFRKRRNDRSQQPD